MKEKEIKFGFEIILDDYTDLVACLSDDSVELTSEKITEYINDGYEIFLEIECDSDENYACTKKYQIKKLLKPYDLFTYLFCCFIPGQMEDLLDYALAEFGSRSLYKFKYYLVFCKCEED